MAQAPLQTTKKRIPSVVTPVILDGIRVGITTLYPSATDTRIDSQSFLEILRPLLLPANFRSLTQSAQNTISLEELKRAGLQAEFNEAALELRLSIPGRLRQETTFELSKLPQSIGQVLSSDPYSGYLNFYLLQPFIDSKRGYLDTRIEHATQINGFVLETGAELNRGFVQKARRLDTRLTKDFEENLLRASAGDVYAMNTGFQSSSTLLGFSIASNFALQPFRNTRPLSRTRLELQSASTVEVYVNGSFNQRLRLGPGVIDLTDFPLATGVNDVALRITDDQGRIETVRLSLLFDAQVLARGTQEYSYAAGAPLNSVEGNRSYDTQRTEFLAFHRYGLSDHLTLGANVQVNHAGSLFGLDIAALTPIGIVSLEGAGSQRGNWGNGTGMRARYRTLGNSQLVGWPVSLRLGTKFKSVQFGPPVAVPSVQLYSASYDAFVQTYLPLDFSVGLGTQYSHARTGTDSKLGTIELLRNWGFNLQSSFTYTHTRSSFSENRYLIGLIWTESLGRNRIAATYDSVGQNSRLNWDRIERKQVNDVRLSAEVGQRSEAWDARAKGLFFARRFQAGAEAQTYRSSGLPQITNTTLSAGTAIAWTSRGIGLSRPINDSFVLVDTVGKGLEDREVALNRIGDEPMLIAGAGWGASILPDLTSYYTRPITVDAAGLPAGLHLEEENFIVRPTYKSGASIILQADPRRTVRGQLLDSEKRGLGLISGQVHSLSGDFSQGFFTTRKGIFLIEGLAPGAYELNLEESGIKDKIRFDVSDSQDPLQNLVPTQLPVKRSPEGDLIL